MNIFLYAAREEMMFERIMSDTGHKRITTFFSDLSIAECYGKSSIIDTFNRVCKHWKNDYKYFTEFVVCLNHKSWEWNDRGNAELVKLYSDLYYKAHDLFYEVHGENKDACNYYFQVTD